MKSKETWKPVPVFKSDTSANPVDLPLEAKDLETKIHEFIFGERSSDFAEIPVLRRLQAFFSFLFVHICGVGESSAEQSRSRRDEKQTEGHDTARVVAQGVIAQLTREYGGNVDTLGAVEVTASGCWAGEAKDVVDLGTNSYFYSNAEGDPGPWICYDFKARGVSPTGYSIRSGDCAYPRSWVLEVSNDSRSWTVVDCRNNNRDLNAPHVTRKFVIEPRPPGSYRFIRFRLTGKNEKGLNEFLMTSFEIFSARPVAARGLS